MYVYIHVCITLNIIFYHLETLTSQSQPEFLQEAIRIMKKRRKRAKNNKTKRKRSE